MNKNNEFFSLIVNEMSVQCTQCTEALYNHHSANGSGVDKITNHHVLPVYGVSASASAGVLFK